MCAAPLVELGRPALDWEAATAIAIARRLHPPMKTFALAVRIELGWKSLSARAVYSWERGEARVPAIALLAAARVTSISVDELVARAHRLHRMGLRPGE
jgi:hypothetical protein